jgi:adenylate cyclase
VTDETADGSHDAGAGVDVLRNRLKARLLLAGVDRAVVEGLGEGDSVLDLIRATVLWGSEESITIAELAERSGLDVELCRRARMLLGLPDPGDEPLCRAEEVEAFQGFAMGMALFGVEPVLHFTRVLGSALGAVAEGALTVFSRALDEEGDAAPLTGDAYSLAAFDALEAFRIVPGVLQIVAKLQFDRATDRLTAEPGQAQTGAVGFVDVTASTMVTAELGIEPVSAAMTGLEERAVELAVAHGGRVVKYIGDEVMFVAPDLAAAVEVAMGLVQQVDADPILRSARGGVAFGPLLSRDGDWFGTTVNTASRLVEKAKARTVLFTGDGAEQVEGASERGRRRLRGLPERVDVWRIES